MSTAPTRAAPRRKQGGTSLTELMVVIAIIGIVVGIAALSAASFLGPLKAAKVAGEIQSAIALARIEAVKRGIRVTLCGSATLTTCADSTDWGSGWLLFAETNTAGAIGTVDAGDTIIRVSNASASEGVGVLASVTSFTLGPVGVITAPTAGLPLTIDVCRGGQTQTRVSTNLSGLATSKATGIAC